MAAEGVRVDDRRQVESSPADIFRWFRSGKLCRWESRFRARVRLGGQALESGLQGTVPVSPLNIWDPWFSLVWSKTWNADQGAEFAELIGPRR